MDAASAVYGHKRLQIWYDFDVPQVHIKFPNRTEIWFIRRYSHNLATAGNEWKWIRNEN